MGSCRSRVSAAVGSSDHPRRVCARSRRDSASSSSSCRRSCMSSASYSRDRLGDGPEVFSYSIHIHLSPRAYPYSNVIHPHSYTQFIDVCIARLPISRTLECGPGWPSSPYPGFWPKFVRKLSCLSNPPEGRTRSASVLYADVIGSNPPEDTF
jgi:hypothetical protein